MASTHDFVRAEYTPIGWTLNHPDLPAPIAIDQVLMDADEDGDGFAVGTVLAVHGLDQAVAQHLPPRVQRALGIGFPNRIGRTQRGVKRVRCVAGKSHPVKA